MTRAGDGLPVKSPTEVGMSSTRLNAIERVVERGIKAGGYPGASVIVGRKGAAVFEKGFGRLSWSESSTPVDAERTIYDIASLSKVVGTTTAIMILYDEKKIGLDDPVVNYIPTFGGGDKDKVTIRQLLTHTSGLPAGRDIWRIAQTPLEARALVLGTSLEGRPGARSEEHTSELQSQFHLVCRLLLEKKKTKIFPHVPLTKTHSVSGK